MIETLKDLEKLFKLCRKQGVQEIDLGTVKFKLGDLPQREEQYQDIQVDEEPTNKYAGFPEGNLTPEQLMHYASGGTPEDDPYLDKQ
jgi:hypothetical protein